MNKDTKALINERILNVINRYLKHGSIVQANWGFFVRGEIESIVLTAYEQGLNDGILAKTKSDKIQI